MTNPMNCSTCEHKQHPDGGWRYMFRNEPTEVCHQYTVYRAVMLDPWHEKLRAMAAAQRSIQADMAKAMADNAFDLHEE